ncbi:MAG TPA: single-stranded DNA-binding protein [Alloiococcus sp.]|nr:single-stranded DNA-binding protein [Alloiococcus sp.]
MINNVTLVGRLTRDAELRYTGSGNAVTSFTIAIDRPFKNNQGNRDADFINCVAWRRTAETVANFTKKGSLVGVTGRIQTRSYENNEGRTVYVTEVVVENFQMLEPKSVTDSRRTGDDQSNNYNQNQSFNTQNSSAFNQNQNNSFNSGFSQNNNNDPFEKDDDSIHITDDDLPF